MTFNDPYRGKTVQIAVLRREQIYATCTGCGYVDIVDLKQLVDQGRGDLTLQRLVESLVCRKSRHSRPTIEVREPPPPPPAIFYPLGKPTKSPI